MINSLFLKYPRLSKIAATIRTALCLCAALAYISQSNAAFAQDQMAAEQYYWQQAEISDKQAEAANAFQWLLDDANFANNISTIKHVGEITIPLPSGAFLTLMLQRSDVIAKTQRNLNSSAAAIHTFKVVSQRYSDSHGKPHNIKQGRVSYFHQRLKLYIETDTHDIFLEPSVDNETKNNTLVPNLHHYSLTTRRLEKNKLASQALERTLKSMYGAKGEAIAHSPNFQCKTHEHSHEHITANKQYLDDLANKSSEADKASEAMLARKTFGQQLHVYRLAIAATDEYNQRVGSGDKSLTYAEMVHAINRVNGIFETDFAIRLEIISDEDLIADNDTTYTDGDVISMLTENQRRLDDMVGSSNYDIGHVLGISGGGVASLASACSNRKAQGVSASASPTSTVFYVDYLAHELAHQLAATHTFNADGNASGLCIGNRVENGSSIFQSSSYEVGSGSTIMSYAGLCSEQNIQFTADPYFHAKSIEQVRNFSQGEYSSYNGSCGRFEDTNNTPPTIDAGSDHTIPAGTPFELRAAASDSDDNESEIIYTWEQYDLGDASSSLEDMHSDKGEGPLMRSVEGSTSPSRYIPELDDVLLGDYNGSKGIRLPTRNRDLNFRATARSGNYGVDQDDMLVTVVLTEHPFSIVQPSNAIDLVANHETLVSWITGDTESSPISCSSVDISLSDDGGVSFAYSLASRTENDGNAYVDLPNINTTQARIKIACSDNIFYSISENNFTIQTSTKPVVTMQSHTPELSESDNNSFSYTISLSEALDRDIALSYNVVNAGKAFNAEGVTDSEAVSGEDFGQTNLPSGSIAFSAGETEKTFTIDLASDLDDEFDEYFQVRLNENTQVDFAIHHALNVILSDDKPEITHATTRSGTSSSSDDSESSASSGNRKSSSGSSSTILLVLLALMQRMRKSISLTGRKH